MDVCNNILYFIYILLATIAVSDILICIFKRKYNNSCYKWSLYIYYVIILYYLYHCVFDGKYSGIIVFSFILFIFFYVTYVLNREKINIVAVCRYIRSISIPLLIISICYLGAKLIIYEFNDNSWWLNEDNISEKIGDWGDFSTCLTAFFALISIFYAYKAFCTMEKSFGVANETLRLQTLASKRTSFDTTFTQMFAQHNVLRERVVRHHIDGYINIFQYCVNHFSNEFKSSGTTSTSSKNKDISSLWNDFNKEDNIKDVSVDFKNYFKYIYHEINIIVCQQDEVLNDKAKQNYVQLIQAQMNYDELLCYFINQVEYLNYWKNRNEDIYERAKTYAENLKKYAFFRELCENRSEYAKFIEEIKKENCDEVSELIEIDWLPKDNDKQ